MIKTFKEQLKDEIEECLTRLNKVVDDTTNETYKREYIKRLGELKAKTEVIKLQDLDCIED